MNDTQGVLREVGGIVVRTSPGVAASAFTLNHLVAILTAVFLAMQILHLGWKMLREWRAGREASS